MRVIVAAIALLLSSFPVLAQHSHGAHQKGPNGGDMVDIAGVHAEILHEGVELKLNIFDEAGTPVKTEGFTASALIVAGADRETVKLAPANDNILTGTAKKSIPSNATMTVIIKTNTGKSGQVRYTAHAD